jgi:hypothetical protein
MRAMFRQMVMVGSAAMAVSSVALRAQAPAARDVSGTYTTQVASPQGPVKAVMVLKKEAATYTGTLAAEGFPTLPITTVTPMADGLKVVADSPDGGVIVEMKMGTGDKVSGKLTYQGMEMPIEGTFAGAGGMVSPSGEYQIKTTEPMMGETGFEVTCVISKGADGNHAGTCTAAAGSAPVSQVSVAGNVVTMGGESPAGPYTVVATVVGTTITGTMTLGGEAAKFTGKFTAK